MFELSEHTQEEEPVQDCDCKRCAIAERDRLRASLKELHELLARYGIVDVYAVDDPDGYDEGATLRRIERLKSFILTPNSEVSRPATKD